MSRRRALAREWSMNRAQLGFLLVLTVGCVPGSALAADLPMPGPPPVTSQVGQTAGGQAQSTTSDGTASIGPPTAVPATPAPAPTAAPVQAPVVVPPRAPTVKPKPAVRLVKRCATQRSKHRRVCRYYRKKVQVKVCTRKLGGHHKYHCRLVRKTAAAAGAAPQISSSMISAAAGTARASTYINSGYTNPLLPGVVRLYNNESPVPDKGWCSGALLLRGIVLTAAHCLYDSAEEGGTAHWYPYANGAMQIVPGNRVVNGQNNYPYGVWNVAHVFVSPTFVGTYPNNDITSDWGIIQLAPDASGHFPGDYTGTFNATWNESISTGTGEMWNTGYPASGLFRSAAYNFGENQFFCNSTLDTVSLQGSATWLTFPCKMNGGASGGPMFFHRADGSWTIVGVNNRAQLTDPKDPNNYGVTSYNLWADGRFGTFWNATLAYINSH
jgi:V8-like Glu-specific endopeptidase